MAKKTVVKKTEAQKATDEKKTEARKELNRQRNEAKHKANLAYMAEHNLKTFPIEKTVTRLVKKGKDTVEVTRTIVRNAAPNTIVARHRNSLDDSRHKAWLEAQKDSPLPANSSTAQHLRAKERAAREKALQIVIPQEA